MSIIDDLKDLHENIMDENDEFITREQYLAKLRKDYRNPNKSEREFEFLKNFMYLILNTEIVNDNTKNLIKSHAKSVRSYVERYNLTVEEKDQLIETRVRGNSDNSRKRLLKFFPDDIIRTILLLNDPKISEYEKMLNNANAKYARNKKMLNNVALNIYKTPFNDNLSEEEFKDLVSTLAIYTKEYMKYVSENIPENQVGYLNYLLSACKLENEDLKRFEILKRLSDGEVNDVIEKIGQTEQEETDIDPEDIDFGDITEADVE